MSDDFPQEKWMSSKEAEQLTRSLLAPARRREHQHQMFCSQLPDEVNMKLKDISLKNEELLKPKVNETIYQVWQTVALLEEMDCKIREALFNYIDDVVKTADCPIRKKVVDLFQAYQIQTTSEQVDRVIWDVYVDMERKLSKDLFIEHLKIQKVPIATITRLYPVRELSPLEKLFQAFDEGYLYPEADRPLSPSGEIFRFPTPT